MERARTYHLNSTNGLPVQRTGLPASHFTYPYVSPKCFIQHGTPVEKCASTFSPDGRILKLPVGHLQAPYRFAHLSPLDSPFPPVGAVMTKTLKTTLYENCFKKKFKKNSN